MRKIYTMKNLVKGLMLSAVMTLGVSTASAQATSTDDVKPATSTEFWMGEEAASGKFYLYNVGTSIFATNETPSETNIDKATLWTANASKKEFSFKDENGNLVIRMTPLATEITKPIKVVKDATDFTLKEGTTTDKGNVYEFTVTDKVFTGSNTRYFNIDTNTKKYYYYSAAEHTSPFNDWLLISETQKKAYTEYVNLFNEAKSYTEAGSELFKSDDPKKTDPIVKQLNDALKSYNYNSYEEKDGGKDKLEAAIKAAKDFINTPTGINGINSTSEAKASEIYGVNGARKSQLTKGLNIVKMSDGSVKKVLVK